MTRLLEVQPTQGFHVVIRLNAPGQIKDVAEPVAERQALIRNGR
jgi:hypothetical protein